MTMTEGARARHRQPEPAKGGRRRPDAPPGAFEQAVESVAREDVDALFIPDLTGSRLITLHGADRAYRLLVEDMADGAVTLTPDGVIAWCNRSFAELLGRPLNRLIGTDASLCVAAESRPEFARVLCESRHGKRSLEVDLLTDSGRRVPTHLSVNPSVVDGLPQALCMVVTDLTEQRRGEAERRLRQHLMEVIDVQRHTERELQESVAALRLHERALAAISQGVMVSDAERRVTYSNAAFETITGYPTAEMHGRSWDILQGPGTDPRPVQAIHDALTAARPFQGEVLNYRKNGEPIWIDLSLTPVPGGSGRASRFVGVLRDVTERRRTDEARHSLQAQLREAQKMEAVGTLAGGIAHDFNNILGSMLGNLALARHALDPVHPASALLDQVGVSGARARSLVGQILAFSRRQPTLLTAQPLEPTVREAVTLLRATLPPMVRLDVDVEASPQPRVLADTTQLQQIVINLCTNAWQAMPDSGGRIAIRIDAVHIGAAAPEAAADVLPPGDYAHLRITDTGRGMDLATRSRIFEPFFSTKPTGTGLGLSVVHGIVASHGGHIAVCSRLEGGTAFDLHFPVSEASGAEVTPPRRGELTATGRGQRVLYIDDDEVMVVMVGRLLEHLGYRATMYSDPTAAVAAVRARPDAFDVIVTDFHMPPMSGLDVARALRGVAPGVPVVISSGFISDELRRDASELGLVEVMHKEHTLEELGALLVRVVGQVPATDPDCRGSS